MAEKIGIPDPSKMTDEEKKEWYDFACRGVLDQSGVWMLFENPVFIEKMNAFIDARLKHNATRMA